MIRHTAIHLSVFALALSSLSLAQEQEVPDNEPLTEIVTIGQQVSKEKTEISSKAERILSIAGAGEDPLQALFSLPGVTFSSDGEPVIRGSAPADNAFYIDLIPAKNLYHIWGNSIFNKYVIQEFELHPAAFSSKYGNATGGVIDVRLREPKNIPLTTTASVSFLQAAALIESRVTDNQAFYVSARQSLLDKLLSEEDLSEPEEGLVIKEKPVSSDYQAKYVWNLNDQNMLALVAAGSSDKAGANLDKRNNEVLVDPDLAGPVDYSETFDSLGLTWNWRSQDERKQFNAIATRITEESDLYFGGNQFIKSNGETSALRMDYSQPIFDSHTARIGLVSESSQYDIDVNDKITRCTDFDPDCPTVDVEITRYLNQVNVRRTTAYLEDQMQITDNQTLTLGLHYSTDDYLDSSHVEPRLRWNYQVNSAWNTYLAVGQYSQIPELEFILTEIGNPDLETVKANHFVWGIGQKLSNGWSWKSDIYYKDISDVVISITDPTAADFNKNYSNDAEGQAYGIELLINKDLTDKWDGWLALSLGKAERTDLRKNETLPFDYDRPVMLDLVANYHLNDRWRFGIKWNYQTGDRYTPIIDVARNAGNPSVLEPVYGVRNSQTSPDYHRLDFRVEYKRETSWGYWKAFADIINVYGRENVSGYEFAPNGVDVLASPPPGFGSNVPVTTSVSDGAIPSIGIEVQF